MKRTLVALGAAAFVLVGCSDTKPSATAGTATSSTPPSASSSPSAPLPPGTTVTVSAGSAGLEDLVAEVTFFAVNQDIAPNATTPPSGGHWAGADVQLCLKKSFKAFTVGWNDWSVSDSHNGQYQASPQTYGEFPTPQYPFKDEPVAAGECVRGWVVFPVALGVQVSGVKYKSNFAAPVFWAAA